MAGKGKGKQKGAAAKPKQKEREVKPEKVGYASKLKNEGVWPGVAGNIGGAMEKGKKKGGTVKVKLAPGAVTGKQLGVVKEAVPAVAGKDYTVTVKGSASKGATVMIRPKEAKLKAKPVVVEVEKKVGPAAEMREAGVWPGVAGKVGPIAKMGEKKWVDAKIRGTSGGRL